MSYSRIRSGEDELQDKKRKISEMQLIICKQNYLKKMGEEMKYISTFDVIYMIARNCLGNSMILPKFVMIVLRSHSNQPSFLLRKNDDNLVCYS